VGTLAYLLRAAMRECIELLDGLGAFAVTTVFGVVTGIAILYVVKWCTPAGWVDRGRRQIAGAIYEVRLFLDSPLIIIKAQGRLLAGTGLYLAALAPALVAMTLPMGLLYLQLDLRYGVAPVAVGESVVVSVEASGPLDDVALEVGEWGRLTAPAVRDRDGGVVYYRLVVDEPGVWTAHVRVGSEVYDKRVQAAPGTSSPVRTSGLAMWWAETDEAPLDGRVSAVVIDQQDMTTDVLGMAWWLYWLLLATVVALVLRKPLRVTL
jgi:hypothetical protein